jgi:hypothetical protein
MLVSLRPKQTSMMALDHFLMSVFIQGVSANMLPLYFKSALSQGV